MVGLDVSRVAEAEEVEKVEEEARDRYTYNFMEMHCNLYLTFLPFHVSENVSR